MNVTQQVEIRRNIWFIFYVLQMFGLILKQEVINNVTFGHWCLFIYGLFDDAVNTIIPYLYKSPMYTDLNFSFFSD
jgi:hypothetical protein